MLNTESCYQAVLARDARFDGVFYIAVASTKIYCRTVCRVKTPLQKNCTFYPTAAAAEDAGYRPCLRCRPELAPGNSSMDAVSRLSRLALARIDEGALTGASVADLAEEFGVTDRHLRRVLESELGVSPIELAQTQRLHLTKRLLTDTDLPITDIAFASGFQSLRRFNTLFKERYRLQPKKFRETRHAKHEGNFILCELGYRPPLDWSSLLNFLALRAVAGVENVSDGCYRRTVAFGNVRGTIAVNAVARKNSLQASLSSSLLPVLVPVLSRLKKLFDLAADPLQIARQLGALAKKHPGLRVPGAFDGFEIAVRAILGQQITVKAATTLAGRFSARFGESLQTDIAGLTHLTPTAERVAEASIGDIAELGIISKRAESIRALAQAVAGKKLSLEPQVDVETQIASLTELPGIGAWTAHYIAMRCLAWPDAFPHTDLVVMKAMGEKDPRKVLARAEAWRPWRSYAVIHLWNTLGSTALTGRSVTERSRSDRKNLEEK
jgi:AraC family transcriptional regulator of adaptative response / DNA-3-methyladenine glycosylase II